jgi:hypothetical protein
MSHTALQQRPFRRRRAVSHRHVDTIKESLENDKYYVDYIHNSSEPIQEGYGHIVDIYRT